MMNVLFITPPTLSLYTPKRGQEICMGASVVTGYLKNKGHDVHHFDCNIMLSTIRHQFDNLSEDDFISLTKKDSLVDILNGDNTTTNTPMAWADWLATEIVDNCKFDTIDQICITLDRRLYTFYPTVSAFAMSLLILKYLDEMGIDVTNIPVHMGGLKGLQMIEAYDPTYIDYVFENVNDRNLMPATDEVLALNPKLKNTSLKIVPYKFTKGCLFKCEFCGDGLRGKKSFRYETADTIVEGIQHLYDQGYTNFRFFNTNVNFKLSHVIDFCNQIVQRGMKIRWSDSANMAVCNEEMFKALAEAGCIKLWFGTEHTSERILKQIRKPCTSAEQVHRVLEWANGVDIWSCCNFIYNFPHETDEEFRDMIDYIAMAREKELMNAYQINSFVLLEDSGYRMYPEKFGIKFRDEFSTKGRH
ncbi:MAG: radical SAM protein, partial [Candidatus Poseidoniales archaeon]